MLAYASSQPVEYEYTGKATIAFDDHHDDYEVDFITGDKFTVQIKKNEAHVVHEDAPDVTFVAAFTDKKYVRLMKYAKATSFAFVPHPKHPSYPVIHNVSMDIVPMLYKYFNKTLFNNGCPERVIFKATTSVRKTAGLAEYASRDAVKKSYRLSLRMDRIKHDPFLLVDVLIHEMIHLYNFKRYAETGDRSLVADAHGPAFQDHVNRINKLGFHINTYLDWETRTTLGTAKDYYVIAAHVEGSSLKGLFWSLIKPTARELDNLLDEVRAQDPAERIKMVVYTTGDPSFRTRGLELTKGFKLGKNYVPYIATSLDNLVDVMHTQTKEPVGFKRDVRIKLNKTDMPYLVLPFDDYVVACRSRKAYDYGSPEAAWESVPLKQVEAYAKTQLKEIYKAVQRGMNARDISERLKRIPLIYMPRFDHKAYINSVRAIIKAEKLNGLEAYRELEL